LHSTRRKSSQVHFCAHVPQHNVVTPTLTPVLVISLLLVLHHRRARAPAATQALARIDRELIYWPKYAVHKVSC
jgi:hypothetical protein